MQINPCYDSKPRYELLELIGYSPTKVLDVGCREGFFVKLLSSHFDIQDSWGIEPDPTVTALAEKNIDHVICALFGGSIDLPSRYFDLICFNDVLEHMYDPWAALKLSRELLTEDGAVLISLPNIRYWPVSFGLLFRDDFNYQQAGILDVSHIRFFTASTMRKMFDDAGFDIEIEKPLFWHTMRFRDKVIAFPLKLLNHLTRRKYESLLYPQMAFLLKPK